MSMEGEAGFLGRSAGALYVWDKDLPRSSAVSSLFPSPTALMLGDWGLFDLYFQTWRPSIGLPL